jgi:hypothetical protein
MLDRFNNIWVIIISILLIFFIFKKIYNLNKPFDEHRFIEQYINQQKLQDKFSLRNIPKNLPKIASYYVGLL